MSRKRFWSLALLPLIAVGQLVAAPQARAEVNVYTTPGQHSVNGREWRTTCEPYSQTKRCRTEIWATQVQRSGNGFKQVNGWAFNNLTYLPLPRATWGDNPLANNRRWTSDDGRQWRTECDTPATGRNGCRSYIQSDVIAYRDGRFVQETKWVFNNQVLVTGPKVPTYERRVLVGNSVEGRPIHAYQVGDPDSKVVKLVLGQMHGEEPAGARTAQALIDDPRQVKGIQLWVIPTINPDGAARGKRQNANGVDLNGNWPVNWTAVTGKYYSGPAPLSEPESRAFTDFVSELQPQHIVSIHQPLYAVDSDSVKDVELQKALVREMQLPSKPLTCRNGCHGTMTQWYNATFAGAAITLEYGYTPTDRYVTETARDALVRVLGGSY